MVEAHVRLFSQKQNKKENENCIKLNMDAFLQTMTPRHTVTSSVKTKWWNAVRVCHANIEVNDVRRSVFDSMGERGKNNF